MHMVWNPHKCPASLLAATERTALETSTKIHPTSEVNSVEEECQEQTTAEGRPEAQLPHQSPRATDHVENVGSQQGEGAIEDDGSAEVVEYLWPQLMPKGETDLMSDVGSRTEPDSMKRKAIEEEEEEVGKKRKQAMPEDGADRENGVPLVQGQAVTEMGPAEEQISEGATDWTKIREQVQDKLRPTLEVSLVAMNGLVTALQSGNRQTARNEKAADWTENALTEVTCMLGKVVDALNRLKNAVEENTKEDRRREERWFEIER